MAIQEKDLLAAIARLQERNAQQANPTERMTLEEYKRMRGLLPAEGAGGKVAGVGSAEITNTISNASKEITDSVNNVNNETTEVSNNTNYVAQDTEDISKLSQGILDKLDNVSKEITNVSKDTSTSVNNTEKITQSVTDKSSEGLYKESEQQTEYAKENNRYQKDQLDALVKLTETFKTVQSPLESFAEKMQAFSPANIKETLLTKFNFKIPGMGGIFDKAIRKEQFYKEERLFGSKESKSTINKNFELYNEQAKIAQKNQAVMDKIKRGLPNASEEQLMKVDAYAKAKEANLAASEKSGEYTVKSSYLKPTNEDVGSTSRKEKKVDQPAERLEPEVEPAKLKPETGQEVDFDKQKYRFLGQQWAEVDAETGKQGKMAEKGIVDQLNKLAGVDPAVNATRKNADDTAKAEQYQEAEGLVKQQVDLLQEIADNTSVLTGETPKTPRASMGGIGRAPQRLAPKMGFGEKLERISSGMVGAAKGVAAIGGSLLVLTLGLKAISTIELESVVKATLAIGGLMAVSKLMGTAGPSMLKGAAGIAALGAAMWVASKGFAAFAEIEWESLAKAGIAIAGLAAGAMVIGGAVLQIGAGAVAIGLLGAAVWVLGKGLQAVGEAIDGFIGSMERLSEIDGSNLIDVGAGLAAVAAGMVAFGAANAVAGVTNLVSGFLGAITPGKTPVEQLLEIAEAGPKIQMAGSGIQSFAEGLTKFSAVDKDKLKIIASLPNDKIIALGEAIGKVTPQTGNAVYGASAENAGVAVAMGGAGTTNNVVAPTNITNTTNTINSYKPDVRNQDSSFRRMLDSRYVPV